MAVGGAVEAAGLVVAVVGSEGEEGLVVVVSEVDGAGGNS